MTNHFHLLIYPEQEEGVIQLMKSISQIYSQYFNRKYKRSGKIWRRPCGIGVVLSSMPTIQNSLPSLIQWQCGLTTG